MPAVVKKKDEGKDVNDDGYLDERDQDLATTATAANDVNDES